MSRSPRLWIRVRWRRLEINLSRKGALLWSAFAFYFVSLCVFSVMGDRGLWTSFHLWRKGKELDQKIERVESSIDSLVDQIERFRKDDRAIERMARQELQLAGENEIQYIFR